MKKYIFDNWKIENKINEGTFSTVYKVTNNEGEISALKHIILPKDVQEVDNLIKQGIIQDYEEYNIHYVNIINNEINIMKKFKDSPYILNFYEMTHNKNTSSNQINYYIRIEYAEDIKTHYKDKKIETNEIVKLGINICTALELCSNINIAHCDIKPENIFIDKNNRFKLGDFSSATTIGTSSSNVCGTLNYVAPEVYNKDKITTNTDIYSLGIVMYHLLSGKLPFISDITNEEEAFNKRMSGKEIPPIENVNKKLMDIILKACSFNEKNRYKNPTQMKDALQKLTQISSDNITVDFSTNSKYESTIDIYDETIQNKKINKNKKTKEKIKPKKIIIPLLIISAICLFGASYMLNKNCQTGYVNRNGICVKGYYYCDKGYDLNADNKCQKTIESKKAKLTYTCKSGYILNGDVCVSENVITPKFVYKCTDGFTLNDKKCEKTETIDAVKLYSCPKDYITNGDQCVSITSVDATSYYECKDSSYKLSGTICTKNILETTAATPKYSCNANGTLNGTVCDYTVDPTYSWLYYTPKCSRGTYNYMDRKCHYSESATLTYTCEKGTLSEHSCIYTTTDTQQAILKYTCPSGYSAVGDKCAKTTGIAATVEYICSDSMTLKGTKCHSKISIDAVGLYECPKGYLISGTTCIEETLPTPIKKYTCSKVYTLNGDKCEKYEIVNSKVHYENKK